MGRKKRYITLDANELITLKSGESHHPKSEFRNHCTSLLMSHNGLDMQFISQYFDITPTTLSGWFDAWEEKGISGLMRQRGQGRKPILSINNNAHIVALDTAAEEHYQDVKGIKIALQEALGTSMSNDTVKRFLKKTITVGIESAVVRKKVK